MAEITKNQKYLNGEGLGKFYGIIKSQWTSADEALKKEILGEGGTLTTLKALEDELKSKSEALAKVDEGLTTAIGNEATAREQADTALGTRITNEIAAEADARSAADKELGNRIDTLTAKGVDFSTISKAWTLNAVDSEDKVLSVENKDMWINATGELVDTDPGDGGHKINYGVLKSALSIAASSTGEKLTISLMGNSVDTAVSSTEVDLSGIVLDNYINSITYHASKEEDYTGDVAAPYIKFTWKTEDSVEGTTDQVLRISVVDLVGIVEAGDDTVTVAAAEGNGNYKVSVSNAFKDLIWGVGEGATTVADGYSNFSAVTAAVKANAKALEDYKTEQAKTDAAQNKALEDYKAAQAEIDAAQNKALTDHVTEFNTHVEAYDAHIEEYEGYKTAQAGVDEGQNGRLDALEAAKTTQAEKDAAQDGRLDALETVLSEAEIREICGLSAEA